MSDTAIKVEGLSKLYKIGQSKSGSFRESLAQKFSFLTGKKKQASSSDFWALEDVSFEIKRGESVGIIGKNGAGKSTLLKVLSRITEPTKGRIEINGRVASLLEVGTGFHPELSGRENIFLNGTILGMTRREIKAKFDEIVDFSGVEKFIDTPVKYYSSGMYVRLAFAVAAHLEPEILIIDEVLAVGDAEFQRKCLGKMGEVAGQGKTVLFVSHNLVQVQNLCTQGILLNKGRIQFAGNIQKAISQYVTNGNFSSYIEVANIPRMGPKNDNFNVEWVEIIKPLEKKIYENDEIELSIGFNNTQPFKEFLLGVTLSDGFSTLIECRSTASFQDLNLQKTGFYVMKVKFRLGLRAGSYNLNIGARCASGLLEYVPSISSIEILPESNEIEEWKRPSAGALITESAWDIQLHVDVEQLTK